MNRRGKPPKARRGVCRQWLRDLGHLLTEILVLQRQDQEKTSIISRLSSKGYFWASSGRREAEPIKPTTVTSTAPTVSNSSSNSSHHARGWTMSFRELRSECYIARSVDRCHKAVPAAVDNVNCEYGRLNGCNRKTSAAGQLLVVAQNLRKAVRVCCTPYILLSS